MRSAALSFFRYLSLAILFLLVTTAAWGQSDRGSISGSILDSSGAAVVGAEIKATAVTTGTVYTATSTSTGAYRIQDMSLGAYNITATVAGFKTAEQKGVVIQINTTTSLDITLQPGDVKETLTVIADAPTLQTQTSDIATIVSTRQIEDLPLALSSTGQSFLRSPETFVFLVPGTAGPGTNDDPHGIFESKLAGGQNWGNEVILDGASTARMDSGSAFDQTAPSVEALTEFKVTTSTVPAEFGRTSGGVESFSTRSGTNSYHGAAFDIFRNEDLDANTWFNNLNGQPRPLDRKNDYGGTFGGPVWIPKLYNGRDKTFFFFSWEQYRQTQGSNGTATVPTAAEKGGDFSSLLDTSVVLGTNPCDSNNPVYQGEIFDPATTVGGCRMPFNFGGKLNVIDPARFSTVAKNVVALIPNPNNGSGTTGNFLFNSSHPVLDTAMTIRADQNLGTQHKLFFSLSRRDQDYLNGTPSLPTPLDGSFTHPFITDYFRVGWDFVINPTLLNHLSVGLNRIYNNSLSTSVTGPDWPTKLGITGASGPVFPVFTFSSQIGYSGFSSNQDDSNFVSSLIVSDSVSWTHGRHNFRFGFDWRSFQYSLVDQSHQSPSFSFDNGQTAFTSGQGLVTGDAFASLLLGIPNNTSLAVLATQPRFVQNYWAGYVQDDFKVRHNLMLNIGLRYDVETPRHEAHQFQSVFDPTAVNPGATGVPGALIFGKHALGADTYFKDIAPRVGFSYAPESLFGRLHNFVIRGGYSIYYAPLTYGDFGQSLNEGNKASPNFNSSDTYNPAIDPKTGNPVLLDTGIPAYTPPPNLDPTQLNGSSGGSFGGITFIGKDYGRPGMVQNWSLELQHELAKDLILSWGYVGTHATRLRSSVAEINNINPSNFSLGAALNTPINAQTTTNVPDPFPQFESLYGPGTVGQALRPFPQYQTINTDCCLENLGQSTYNAMLVKVERRFRNGLNLLASYTYAKTLTDADSAMPIFASFSSGIQNSYNLKQEKSLSVQDIPHTLVLSYIYELPVGKGKPFANKGGVVNALIGGWQIAGVMRYQSGQPTIFGCQGGLISGYDGCIRYDKVVGQGFGSSNSGSFNNGNAILANRNNGTSFGCSPNTDGTFSAPAGGVATLFNCGAFFDQNVSVKSGGAGAWLFGNMPRVTGAVRSQDYFNEDFSLIKRTTIRESHSLLLKLELPNAFNRHVFTRPDTGITSSTFGISGGTISPQRTLQLTLRYEF